MNVAKRTFDAVIVGAGGAGLRAALQLSEAGLKTAVRLVAERIAPLSDNDVADLCASFQAAVVDVMVDRTRAGLRACREAGISPSTLVVAGGVGANRELRRQLDAAALKARITVYYPELEFCTDNGAMIALAGALRFQAGVSIKPAGAFAVRPRWPLAELTR